MIDPVGGVRKNCIYNNLCRLGRADRARRRLSMYLN